MNQKAGPALLIQGIREPMNGHARRKSWPLEAVTVRLRHSKIHATDCTDCETKEGMLDHIQSDLEFRGTANPRATLEAA